MKKNGMHYLIAVDLEGIHGVVGEAYKTLNDTPDYETAKLNAAKEINAVAAALFDSGAERVTVWDNHGGGNNIAPSLLDPRVVFVSGNIDRIPKRYFFLKGDVPDGMILLGYHAREGAFCGVLAHTYNSRNIQYFKLNGKYIGEVELDSFIAGDYGFSTIMLSSDDVCVGESVRTLPEIQTVITKYGEGRNQARLREPDEVLAELYGKALKSTKHIPAPVKLTYPCELEIRHTRAEAAAEKMAKYSEAAIAAVYGEDSHTVKATLTSVEQLEHILYL